MRVRGVLSARSGAGLYLGVCAVATPVCRPKDPLLCALGSSWAFALQFLFSRLFCPCILLLYSNSLPHVFFFSLHPVALFLMPPPRLRDRYFRVKSFLSRSFNSSVSATPVVKH